MTWIIKAVTSGKNITIKNIKIIPQVVRYQDFLDMFKLGLTAILYIKDIKT